MANKAKVKVKKKGRFWGFIAVLLLVIMIFNTKGILKMVFPVRYESTVFTYAREYKLDYHLVMAVIKSESNFQESAESHKGAKGLMQFTDSTAKWVADKIGIQGFTTDLLDDHDTNILMGCFYLNYLLEKYNGNEKTALAAYNAGPGNVDKWLADRKYSKNGIELDNIPYEETKNYVWRVTAYKQLFMWLYED